MSKAKLLIVTLLAVASMAACGKNVDPDTNKEVSTNMVKLEPTTNVEMDLGVCIKLYLTDKACSKNDAVISKDLDIITSVDGETGDKWNEIDAYWNETNSLSFVNYEVIPDGLPRDGSLCILVMGYCLNPDGTMRDELIGRLETALNAANKYPDAYVLVTGGGTASDNPKATEADCMAEWLSRNGVNDERIIVENKSLTSAENAILSYDILARDYPSIKNVAIVTSDYHVPLGCLLFNTQFILKSSDIRVISNAAYVTDNAFSYDMKSQSDWVRRLYEVQK